MKQAPVGEMRNGVGFYIMNIGGVRTQLRQMDLKTNIIETFFI